MDAYEKSAALMRQYVKPDNTSVFHEWRKLETKLDGTDLIAVIELKSDESLRSAFADGTSIFESWSVKADNYSGEPTLSKAVDTYLRLFEVNRQLELHEKMLKSKKRPLMFLSPEFDYKQHEDAIRTENLVMNYLTSPFMFGAHSIRNYSDNIFKHLIGKVEIRIHSPQYETLPAVFVQVITTRQNDSLKTII